MTRLLAALIAALPALSRAAEEAPPPAFASPTFEPLLRLGIALAAILCAAWGLGMLARRRRVARGIADARIDVLAMRSLGPRQRVALLEVGDRRLLVGIGSDSIRTLADLSDSLRFEQELEGQSGAGEPAAPSELVGAIGRFEGLDG
jgi:flagellar protein FliO/FliZ